jgi:hypothetical protein
VVEPSADLFRPERPVTIATPSKPITPAAPEVAGSPTELTPPKPAGAESVTDRLLEAKRRAKKKLE